MSDRADLTMLIPGLGSSGGIRTLIEWANRSAAQGERVVVVAPFDGPMGGLLGPDVDVRTLSGRGQRALDVFCRHSAKRVGSLPEMLAQDLTARLRLPESTVLVAGFLPWYGSLASQPNVLGYAQHWEPIWVDGRLARRRVARLMSSAPHLVVNSGWLRDRLPPRTRSHAMLVFPGVELGTFFPGPAQLPASSLLRVAALGRLDVEWKGSDDLMAALAARSGARPVELYLFGTADTGSESTPWGRIVRLGYLDAPTLAQLYRDVDLVVNPSWQESFPLPPLEAMACGAVVLTTTAGTEDYAVDGVNCLTVPPRAVPELARALDRFEALTPHERSELRDQGLATAQCFTWANGFTQFRGALEAVAPGAGR